MSAEKQLQIKDLTPTTKGQFTLNFEVAQIIKRDESADTLLCRIVDQTGVINAYFDQYAKFIKQGSVFEIKNFKCKVFDHHLRLEIIKTSVISKKPLKICFRDLENDLSQKFYVAANKTKQAQKQQKNDAHKEDKKQEKKTSTIVTKNHEEQKQQKIQSNEGRKKKATYINKDKEIEKSQKNNQNQNKTYKSKFEKQQKAEQKRFIEKKYQKQPQKLDKKEKDSNANDRETNNYRNRKGSQKINTNQTRITGRERKWQQAKKNQKSKVKYVQKIPQITIKEMPDYQELEASFYVFISLNTIIKKQDYFLCKVSDQTGSTYFQFEPKMGKHLSDKSWYKLIGYKIYGDRDYGFIASEQSNSSYELLQDYDKVPDKKLIWK